MKKLIQEIPVLLKQERHEVKIDWDGNEGSATGRMEDVDYEDWGCSFNYIVTATRQVTPAIFDSPAEANDLVFTSYIMDLKIYRQDNEINPAYIDSVEYHGLLTAIERNLNIIN